MGVVYKAQHVRSDRWCALKWFRPAVVTMLDVRANFDRCSRVNHPSVVQHLDLNEAARYVTLAWVGGEALRWQLKREKRLPQQTVISLVLQLAHGLLALHREGVIHRDIRPVNIHRVGSLPVLLDVGVPYNQQTTSRPKPDLEQSGPQSYMAPEVLMENHFSELSDIYSLAVLAYHASTGKRPTRNSDGDHVNNVELEQGIDKGLLSIIQRGLKRDPAERFQDMGRLQAALLTCSGKPITTRS